MDKAQSLSTPREGQSIDVKRDSFRPQEDDKETLRPRRMYGSLDNDIYMKIPEGCKMPEMYNHTSQSMHSIKLQRSLYGLKQSGCMWYNHLSEYLLKEIFQNNPIYPCVFIKKTESGFAIVIVYVDDLNLVGTLEELAEIENC